MNVWKTAMDASINVLDERMEQLMRRNQAEITLAGTPTWGQLTALTAPIIINTSTGNAPTKTKEQALTAAPPPVPITDAMIATVDEPGADAAAGEWGHLVEELQLTGQIQIKRGINRRQREAAARRRILLAMQRDEVPVYPWALVNAFLQEQVRKMQQSTAAWSGLDRVVLDWVGVRQYTPKLPVEVIRTMKRVIDLKPKLFVEQNALGFEVSVITRHPDPFLAIAGAGEPIVVAHWDEPGFSIAGKKTGGQA